MVQLRLANDCVGEFMRGYRKSRDDEIEKMMNVYFKEFDEKEDEKEGDDDDDDDGKEIVKYGRRKRRRKSKWNTK